MFAVDAASALAASLVQRLEGVSGLAFEQEARGVGAQLAKDALAADVGRALLVGFAQVLLHALVFGALVGSHVALEHADGGDGGIADGVFLAE